MVTQKHLKRLMRAMEAKRKAYTEYIEARDSLIAAYYGDRTIESGEITVLVETRIRKPMLKKDLIAFFGAQDMEVFTESIKPKPFTYVQVRDTATGRPIMSGGDREGT